MFHILNYVEISPWTLPVIIQMNIITAYIHKVLFTPITTSGEVYIPVGD